MEENREDEVYDHQDQGTIGLRDGKQTDQADHGEIDTDCGLLKSARIDKTLRVDIGVEDEKKVVPIGEVDQVQSKGSESKDQGCNDRVRNCCLESVKTIASGWLIYQSQ